MYRIFIVEDDEIISEVLKKNLSSWGYDVSCAEDFSNIIQEFVRRDPQLVLLDLKLPFYNGFHWCEEIRRIMTKLWESDSFIDDNTLTVNITRLRRKLEKEGLKEFIITKKGLGYMV